MKILNNIVVIVICFFSFCASIYGLENIKVEGEEIYPKFNNNVKIYNVYTNKNEVNILLDLSKDEINMDNLNNISLNKGLNKIEITILKNDIKEKYTVNIYKDYTKRDSEDNATLSELTIEGYDIDFDPNNFNYELTLTELVDNLDIKYTTDNPNTYVKVTGNCNFNTNNNINIKVISENKKVTNEYNIKVNNTIPVSINKDEVLNDPLNIETVSPIKKTIISIIIIVSSIFTIYFSYKLIFKRGLIFS